jgi:ATP-dependent RNA helicase DDX42
LAKQSRNNFTMGWFDGSSSEEEEEKSSPPKAPNDGEDEEDLDPLDAYMKSLQSEDASSSQRNHRSQQHKATRLDVDNEEEATSHWETKAATSNKTNPEEDRFDDVDGGLSKSEARNALSQTFHKAGDARAHRQVDIQLEKVSHSSVNYAPMQRKFWSSPTDTQQGHEWRQSNSVTCHPSIDPLFHWEEFRDVLGTSVLEWIYKHQYTKPTLVQAQTLSVALSGCDAIVTASTGSGKTLSYLWPLVVHLRENTNIGARGLVLCPTRELALQVVANAKSLGKSCGLKALAIIGGNMGRYQLSQELTKQRPQMIVATPGRLLDVLSVNKKELSLQEVTMIVLDEADKMLQMGFSAQVTQLLEGVRPDKQTLMTSATMSRKLESVASKWMSKNVTRISVGRTGKSSEHVDQHVMVLPSHAAKVEFLRQSLPSFVEVGLCLVFIATRDGCEQLADQLKGIYPNLQTLHGDKHQLDRNQALKHFARGESKLLLATDVAGRGLDMNVSTVINFDPAKNLDTHVHRVGRAGRLSTTEQRTGAAYTLLLPTQSDFAHVLKNAMEREGREISPELEQLAGKSKRSGNVDSRSRWNKSGLGFASAGDGHAERSNNTNNGGNRQSESPPAKKSRWGP